MGVESRFYRRRRRAPWQAAGTLVECGVRGGRGQLRGGRKPADAGQRVGTWFGRMEAWLEARADWIALAAIAAWTGAGARFAGQTWLDPDEGLIFWLSNQEGWLQVYRLSLTNAHPPLYYLLLHGWSVLGRSEAALRFLSLLCSAGAIWFCYRWLRLLFGAAAGLVGVGVLAGSQALLETGGQLRQYALLLLGLGAALYFTERGFAEHRLLWLGIGSAALCGALATHYSAVWAAAGLGLAGLLRVMGREIPRRLKLGWLGWQAAAAATLGWLYLTHISRLRGGGLEREAVDTWLRESYPRPGQSGFEFALSATRSLFDYLYGTPAAGGPALALFLVGAAVLLAGPGVARASGSRVQGVGLVAPLGAVCAGALSGVYPFGGTRHDLFILPLAAAGPAFLVSRLLGGRVAPALVGLAILWPVWRTHARPEAAGAFAPERARSHMVEAIRTLRREAAPGSLVVADVQSAMLLGYYLGEGRARAAVSAGQGLMEYGYGGYRVITPEIFEFTTLSFGETVSRVRRVYRLGAGDALWCFDAGRWGTHVGRGGGRQYWESRVERFGGAIGVGRIELVAAAP